MLHDSPADIVRRLLVQLGHGVMPPAHVAGTPWPISTAKELPNPDDTVTVRNTQGTDDGRMMVNGRLVYHYGIQVRVRATDEQTGWVKSETIRTTLAESVRRTVVVVGANSYRVHAVTRIGPTIPLGDETPKSKRKVFTINCTVAVTA